MLILFSIDWLIYKIAQVQQSIEDITCQVILHVISACHICPFA